MAQQKYKRKIYIIDPDFQYRMIRKSCLVGVAIIFMSLIFLAVVHHLYGNIEFSPLKMPNPFDTDPKAIAPQSGPTSLLSMLWPVMAVSVGITLVFLFFYVTIVTHRMAGPIFRIRRVIREMADGDISGEIRLRDKDEFKHLAKEVNNLKASLREKVIKLNELVKSTQGNNAACQKNISRIEEILSGFKID